METTFKSGYAEEIKIVTWLLAFYLFLTPLDFFPLIPGASILRFLAFFPLLGLLFYVNSLKIYVDRYFLLAVIYTLLLLITSFYSVSIYETQQRLFSVGTNLTLILLLTMLDYSRFEIQLLRKAIISSCWLALLMLLYISRGEIAGRATIELGEAAQDPNYLVGYFIFAIIYHLEQITQKKKFMHLAFITVFIGVILLTGSRGGLLAVFGAGMYYLLIWIREQKLKISLLFNVLFLLSLLAIIVYFSYGFLPIETRYRFLPTVETLLEGGETRFVLWESIIESFNEAPLMNQLFGMGAGTVSYFTHNNQVGHNIWFDSLIETGIIGTVVLFAFYFSFLKKANNLNDHVVASSFFGYILMALTMSLYGYRPIWNILLLILILKNYDIKDKKMTSGLSNKN